MHTGRIVGFTGDHLDGLVGKAYIFSAGGPGFEFQPSHGIHSLVATWLYAWHCGVQLCLATQDPVLPGNVGSSCA